MASKLGGWAGEVLRVDLSTGRITRENTFERYGDVLGGTGIGYKVLWDEVPAGTDAFDPANKLIFGVGVLAGTGVPCNGRTAITTIFPTVWPKHLVGSGHMGGQFAARLKYAGFDAIIVEGQADHPVWLHVKDGTAVLRDARSLWGQGIRQATLGITQEIGEDSAVAAIGQAGENRVPMAVVMNSLSHSAGGVGGVMGAKNLKAIAVQGRGAVRIAGDKGEWEKLVKLHLTLLGANNQHVVPSFPTPQSEYYNPSSRWIGAPGKRWGAAPQGVALGSDIHSLNKIAYRTNNAVYFLGDSVWKYTVRGNGCSGCPIRCHTILKVPSVAAKYGINEVGQNTCAGLMFGRQFFKELVGVKNNDAAIEAAMIGMHLADDLGVWCNYMQVQRDFIKLYYNGTIKAKLGADEYKSIAWDKYEKGDPSFLFDLLPRIAHKRGELGTALGLGTGAHLQRWGIPETDWTDDHSTYYWKMGHPKHHANEDDGQCGVIINTQYNRDAQCHSHCNFVRSGLPIEVQKKIVAGLWGSPDGVDAIGDYRPMNVYKARRAKWSVIRKELHDSMSICNWMGPWIASPLKERGYGGDDTIESKYYSLAVGRQTSREELDRIGERIFTLHRALTIRDMNEVDMRGKHDTVPGWVYKDKKDLPAFSKGTIRMDRDDIAKGMDLFYAEMKWDQKTGAPTAKAYEDLGLKQVAQELRKKNLVGKA